MIDVIEAMRRLGQLDALDLRGRAKNMTGTEIIAEEIKIPDFDPTKDYSGFPAGAPVADAGQVWLLLQPYNAAWYSGRPEDLRALWGLAHTTDPAHAKAWVSPYGTSGVYMRGECYRAADGTTYRARYDNTVWDAGVYPAGWGTVG